jgi:hypothetical protein
MLKNYKFCVFVMIVVVAIIVTLVLATLIDKASGPEVCYSGEIDSLQFFDGRAIMQLPDGGVLVIPLLGDEMYDIDFRPGEKYEVWVYPANKRLVKIVLLEGVLRTKSTP